MIVDSSQLTLIPFGYRGNVYRSPMPFSSFDAQNRVWEAYLAAKITDVIILAESHELSSVGGKDLLSFYRSNGLLTHHIPIPDFRVPEDRVSMEAGLNTFESRAVAGMNIAIHCLAGVGRTGLFLSCVGKRHLSLSGQEAIRWIRQIIPGALENPNQENYVLSF